MSLGSCMPHVFGHVASFYAERMVSIANVPRWAPAQGGPLSPPLTSSGCECKSGQEEQLETKIRKSCQFVSTKNTHHLKLGMSQVTYASTLRQATGLEPSGYGKLHVSCNSACALANLKRFRPSWFMVFTRTLASKNNNLHS